MILKACHLVGYEPTDVSLDIHHWPSHSIVLFLLVVITVNFKSESVSSIMILGAMIPLVSPLMSTADLPIPWSLCLGGHHCQLEKWIYELNNFPAKWLAHSLLLSSISISYFNSGHIQKRTSTEPRYHRSAWKSTSTGEFPARRCTPKLTVSLSCSDSEYSPPKETSTEPKYHGWI